MAELDVKITPEFPDSLMDPQSPESRWANQRTRERMESIIDRRKELDRELEDILEGEKRLNAARRRHREAKAAADDQAWRDSPLFAELDGLYRDVTI